MEFIINQIKSILQQETTDVDNLAKHLAIYFQELLKEKVPDIEYFKKQIRALTLMRDGAPDVATQKFYEGRITQVKLLENKMYEGVV